MSLTGFVVGKIRQTIWTKTIGSHSYIKYRHWTFFLLFWLLCAFGPYLVMKTYYWIEATALPVPPGWTLTRVQTTVLGWDNGAGFHIRIEGHDANEALQFYRQYFEEKGWSDQSDRWAWSADSNGTEFTYGKVKGFTKISFGILSYDFDYRTKKGYQIEYQPGQKRIIYLSYMN